jgi:ketosteroid isomerase-like protein
VVDFLQSLFFESPLYLTVFSFLLFAVTLFARRRLTGAAARWSLFAALALIAFLFIIQQVVVTERDRIQATLDDFVDAIAAQNVSGVERAIGETYNSEGMGRKEIVDFVRSSLESLNIYDTRFTRRDVTIDGDHAEMIIVVWATVRIHGGPGEYHQGRWQIGWARENGQWKIVSLRPEIVDAVPIETMSRLRAYVP